MKRLIFLFALILFLSACDSKLSDTLKWMSNTYNPGKRVLDLGHGQTGWYTRTDLGERLASGVIETFTYDGCQMTLHIKDEGLAYRTVHISLADRFNLTDINPRSIKVSTFTHFGGFYCAKFDAEERKSLDCDHAMVSFSTRQASPVIEEKIYQNLKGSDHEYTSISKSAKGHFWIDNIKYADQFVKALRLAVKLCGGKPEPFE